MSCGLREQRLRKCNAKDFMSDEREIENEINNFSVNRGKSNIYERNEKETAPFGDWVISQSE